MFAYIIRIEKEKSQLKAEADDLRGQVDHVGKGKVHLWLLIIRILIIPLFRYTFK